MRKTGRRGNRIVAETVQASASHTDGMVFNSDEKAERTLHVHGTQSADEIFVSCEIQS